VASVEVVECNLGSGEPNGSPIVLPEDRVPVMFFVTSTGRQLVLTACTRGGTELGLVVLDLSTLEELLTVTLAGEPLMTATDTGLIAHAMFLYEAAGGVRLAVAVQEGAPDDDDDGNLVEVWAVEDRRPLHEEAHLRLRPVPGTMLLKFELENCAMLALPDAKRVTVLDGDTAAVVAQYPLPTEDDGEWHMGGALSYYWAARCVWIAVLILREGEGDGADSDDEEIGAPQVSALATRPHHHPMHRSPPSSSTLRFLTQVLILAARCDEPGNGRHSSLSEGGGGKR
jgi:hypothetical protein